MDHTVIHFEIPADDMEALAQFYRELLGWKIEEMEGMEGTGYLGITTSTAEGALSGGMMKRSGPAHLPTNYVWVESVSDYLAKAKDLGAKVIVDKTEIPGMGWFATLMDPQGNPLGLFEALER